MDQYDNNMKGVLFRNDKKESDKHPDYKGNCEVEGREFWMSAWINTSKKGEKYMSVKFELKDGQGGGGYNGGVTPQATAAPSAGAGNLGDDDIPFLWTPVEYEDVKLHNNR